jgi:hypothetical protein
MAFKLKLLQASYLLDTAVPADEKLYGYHRLDDPLVVIQTRKEY